MAKPGFTKHRKFLRLVHMLKMPPPHVLGHVQFMWDAGAAMQSALLGDSVEVELAAGWVGVEGEFCKAVLAVGLIDLLDDEVTHGNAGNGAVTHGNGAVTERFVIHDFEDHAPAYVLKNAATHQRTCLRCGVEFVTKVTHGKFCSNACRVAQCKERSRLNSAAEDQVTQGNGAVTEGGNGGNGGNGPIRPVPLRSVALRSVPEEEPEPEQKPGCAGEQNSEQPNGQQPATKQPRKCPPSFCAHQIDIPPELDTDDFRSAWADFVDMRVETKKKMVETSARSLLKKLAAWGPLKATCALRVSIENQWQGVFEPDERRTDNRRGRNGTSTDPRGSLRYRPELDTDK